MRVSQKDDLILNPLNYLGLRKEIRHKMNISSEPGENLTFIFKHH